MAMKVESVSRLRTKIAELKEEKEITDLAAIQGAETLRRDCASLREDATRLEQDCAILRGREAKDRERIKCLLGQIGSKEREFNEKLVKMKVDSRDLERGQRESTERICELEKANREQKEKCCWLEARLSRLASAKRMAEGEILKLREMNRELEARLSLLVEIEKNVNEKFVSFELENVGLERAKKRAEEEANEWKEKYGEQLRRAEDLRAETDTMEKEFIAKCVGLELAKRDRKDEAYFWKRKCGELEGQVLVLEEGKKEFERNESKFQEKIVSLGYAKRKADSEVDVWKKKCRDLQSRVLVFEEGKMEFGRKETEFREKTVELEYAKRKADDEVNVWKKKCGELEGRVLVLEEEKMEFKRKEAEFREKTIELECAKRKADDEVNVWKKKCGELEGRALVFEGEKLEFERKETKFREKIVELECAERKADDEVNVWKKKCGELEGRVLVFDEEKMEFEWKETEFRGKTIELECAKRKTDDEVDVWKKKCEKLEGRVLMLVEENSLLLETVKEGESMEKSVDPISITNEDLSKRSSANMQRGTEEDCRLDLGIRRKRAIKVVDEEDGMPPIQRRRNSVEVVDLARKAFVSSSFKARLGIPTASLHSCDSRKFGGGRNLMTASKQHTEDFTQRRTEEDCLLDSEKRRKRSIEVVDTDNVGTVHDCDDVEDGPLIIHRRKMHVETANPGKSCKAHSQIPLASLRSCETGKYGGQRTSPPLPEHRTEKMSMFPWRKVTYLTALENKFSKCLLYSET